MLYKQAAILCRIERNRPTIGSNNQPTIFEEISN
jgi:hypothetical protein